MKLCTRINKNHKIKSTELEPISYLTPFKRKMKPIEIEYMDRKTVENHSPIVEI